MDSLSLTFEQALTFDEMVAEATTNVDLFMIARRHAVAPADLVARVAATGRRWHLLTISEDWCGDSVNTLPWVDALAGALFCVNHRIIRRDEHPELMDAHLTNGHARAIPVVLLLDDAWVERGWWGPRPAALQRWFESAEAQAMTKEERYKVLRARYARDRGRAILEEITALIERVAAQDGGFVDCSDSATAYAAR